MRVTHSILKLTVINHFSLLIVKHAAYDSDTYMAKARYVVANLYISKSFTTIVTFLCRCIHTLFVSSFFVNTNTILPHLQFSNINSSTKYIVITIGI